MKFLLSADWHLGKGSISDVAGAHKNKSKSLGHLFLGKTFEVMDHMFNKYADQVDAFGILGDLNDRRIVSNNEVTYETIRFFERHKDKRIFIIIGNHDVYYNDHNIVNTIFYLEMMFPNITIVPENTLTVDNVLMVNWVTEENKKVIEDEMEKTNCKYLFGHFDVVGANLGSGRISVKGYDPKSFSKFNNVFTGHYHTQNTIENVVYIGNPIQTKISEANEDKGVIILDTETGEWHRDNYPLTVFNCIHFDDVNGIEDFSIYSDQVVELTIDKSSELYTAVEHERLIKGIKEYSVDTRIIVKNILGKKDDVEELVNDKVDISDPKNVLNTELSKYDIGEDVKSYVHTLYDEAKTKLEQ